MTASFMVILTSPQNAEGSVSILILLIKCIKLWILEEYRKDFMDAHVDEA